MNLSDAITHASEALTRRIERGQPWETVETFRVQPVRTHDDKINIVVTLGADKSAIAFRFEPATLEKLGDAIIETFDTYDVWKVLP